jgi:Fe-S-cluster containining protein
LGSPEDFLDENGKWQCTQCSACCRFMESTGLPPELREWDRGDGACKHLQEDNSCGIYSFRPPACRTTTYPVHDRVRAAWCHTILEAAVDDGRLEADD